ncbi:MAG: toxin-antitoxin system HicB family antitoxin [Bacteroidales bacterium]|jgi:predicted DNA-binding protein|nr:toxin-antitoxin system HicB family antitoxin [Bacteroidales bacterium]
MESVRIQTVLRLSPELMERVKRNARKQKCSFNSYVEQVLDQATEQSFPSLPEDFKVSEEVLGLCMMKSSKPSSEALAADPKLAYLWTKYGKE